MDALAYTAGGTSAPPPKAGARVARHKRKQAGLEITFDPEAVK
jgi:hypothetical protein